MPAMSATEVTLEIVKGDTFIQIFRWEQEVWAVAGIQSISHGASALITLQTPVDIPDGWRVCVVDALGLTQLNAQKDDATLEPLDDSLRRATILSTTTLEFNGVSTALFKVHSSGSGFLMWHPPVDLSTKSARMSIKDRVDGTVLLSSLTTPTPDIVLTVDNALKLTKAVISAALTAAMKKAGRFDLEMMDSSTSDVEKTFKGPVTLATEITTPIT